MKKAIILAAGRGTRMKSDSFKVMHEIGGRPMIAGIIDTLRQMQLDEVAAVVSKDMDIVQKTVAPHRTFVQENALGTAHAALAAADMIAPFDGTCFVLFGDHPLLTPETLAKTQKACEDGCDVVVIGFEPDDPARYGRLIVDAQGLEAIVEYKDATPEQRQIRLCNSGAMCVNGQHLLHLLRQVKNENAAGEFYLTDIVAIAQRHGLKTGYILGDKEEVAGVNSDFSYQITEISRYAKAEVNQDLFDQVFGKDAVKDEADFRAKIAEGLKGQFAMDTDFKFIQDVRKYMEDKVGALVYPDALLKRVMLNNNKDKGQEFVDKNYDMSIKELTWHLIKEQLVAANGIKIEDADVKETAKEAARAQFAQYGMNNIPEEYIDNYATDMLKKKEYIDSFVDRSIDRKLTEALKKVVKLNEKTATLDEFNKLMQGE